MGVIESVELSLSLTELGLDVPARQMGSWAAGRGFRWVQLDAAAPQFRPRQLDHSARRDLAGVFSRADVRLSGLDLWIPPEHFAEAAHVDRAIAAVCDAAAMAGELRRLGATAPHPVVAIVLPEQPVEGVRHALAAAADAHGAIIADHAPDAPAASMWGADPAMLLMVGRDPGKEVSRRGEHVVSARLSDANAMGRCAVGKGRLDVLEYAMALATGGFQGPVVVDLRGLPDPERAIEQAQAVWKDAVRLPGT